MKKVYLVIELKEAGFICYEEPYKVYQSKEEADDVVHRIIGTVKEIDYVGD